jgi:hypothetical protein
MIKTVCDLPLMGISLISAWNDIHLWLLHRMWGSYSFEISFIPSFYLFQAFRHRLILTAFGLDIGLLFQQSFC